MQPATSNTRSLPDDGWPVYPLSITDINRLSRLRLKIKAKEFLGRRQPCVEPVEAARHAWARWLMATGRLTEEVDS